MPSVNQRIDAPMDIGTVDETISVVASSSQIQSDSAMVAKLVESKQIEKMMLNGRNPLFLAIAQARSAAGRRFDRIQFWPDVGRFFHQRRPNPGHADHV